MTLRSTATHDAFGLIGTTFRELGRKTLIFFERAVPISPNTRPGAGELAQMKPTGTLINVARGEVVDQPALVAALASR